MTSATITVQLSSLASVDSVAGFNVTNRDQIVQRALDTGSFPTAVFEADDDTFKAVGAVGVWTKADSVTLFDDFNFGEKQKTERSNQ